MSLKSPKRICLTLAELYYLIQKDREIWGLCGIMEKMLSELPSLSAEMLRAMSIILVGLMFGSTRAELVEKVSDTGYGRSYAKKFVDGIIKRVRGLLGGGPIFRIAAEPEPVKGQFTKPYSRAYSRLGRPERGRPPLKYKLEEHYMTKLSKRMEELVNLVTFLSGSSLRLQELFVKMLIEIVRRPELRKIFLEVLEKEYSMPPDKLREFEENMVEKGDDFVKQVEERLRSYKDLRDELVGSMEKEIHKILGLSPPPEKEQENSSQNSMEKNKGHVE
jgi:hypothetical protein